MNRQRMEDERESCRKRPWVLSILADDEQISEGEALPPGLQFHLSRCPGCRTLADQLRAVTSAVSDLGRIDPPEGLADRAESVALIAIADGARLTGRVDIPGDGAPAVGWAERRRFPWRRATRYAAAAVVLLAVGLRWARRGAEPGHRSDGASFITHHDGSGVPSPDARPAPWRVPEPEGLADSTGTSPAESVTAPPGTPSRSVCNHHSHVEAAFSEDEDCIHRAVILPHRSRREPLRADGFDKDDTARSTRRLLSDN